MATTDPPRSGFRSLLEPRSLIGALAILAVLSFFGFGLRFIDEAVESAGAVSFAVGQPVAVTPTTSFTPANDWSSDPTQSVPDLVVVAHRNGWEMRLAGGLVLQPGQSLEGYADAFRDDGDDRAVQVGELETFVTAGGQHGVTWETHRSDEVSVVYLVAEGDEFAQLEARGSPDTLDSVEDDLEQMAASITVSGAAS
jgi:hypothetical protein